MLTNDLISFKQQAMVSWSKFNIIIILSDIVFTSGGTEVCIYNLNCSADG